MYFYSTPAIDEKNKKGLVVPGRRVKLPRYLSGADR
jgi:hypothetical protein